MTKRAKMTTLERALHRWAKPASAGTRIPYSYYVALDEAGYLDQDNNDGHEVPLSKAGVAAMQSLGYQPPGWEKTSTAECAKKKET